MEQRQPVLHAGVAAALADRLVENILAPRRAEAADVVAAETGDRLLRQHHLAHRHQIQLLHRRGGALALRIKGTHGLQRVAEEVEADRGFRTRREEIENAAAHRIFAGLAHGRRAGKAVQLQPGGDGGEVRARACT